MKTLLKGVALACLLSLGLIVWRQEQRQRQAEQAAYQAIHLRLLKAGSE